MTSVRGRKAEKQGGGEGEKEGHVSLPSRLPCCLPWNPDTRHSLGRSLPGTPFTSRCPLTNTPGSSAKNDAALILQLRWDSPHLALPFVAGGHWGSGRLGALPKVAQQLAPDSQAQERGLGKRLLGEGSCGLRWWPRQVLRLHA